MARLHLGCKPLVFGMALVPVTVSVAETDLYDLPLSELMEVRITTASLFTNDHWSAPANVEVIEAEEWQRQGARRTVDILAHMPSTQILPVAYGYNAIAIRGYAGVTSTRGIATSLDGVRLNNFTFGSGQTDTSNINPGILDRVEVIRGPASAIHGSDAFHGVISLHAFESSLDQLGTSAEAGENGYYQAAARLSGEAAERIRVSVAAAASGQSDQEQAYDDNPVEKEQRYHSGSMSVKLVSDPQQSLSWRWGLYADDFGSDDFPSSLTSYNTGQDTTVYMTRLAVVKTLDDRLSVEAAGYYRDNSVDRWVRPPLPGVQLQLENQLEESASGLALTLRRSRMAGEATQWAVSVGQDRARFDEGHNDLVFMGMSVTGEPGGVGSSRNISSVVLDADTRFADEQWGVSYGTRFDHYSDFGSEVSPRLGLRYLPTQSSAIKLLYGHAFRAPTVAELYFVPLAGVGATGNPDLKPETIDTLELVFMQQGRNWQGELIMFANHWEDAIMLDLNDPSTGDYVNDGENRAQGVELRWALVQAPWQVEFNTAWTRSHNDTTDEDYRLFPRLMTNLVIGRDVPYLATRFTLAARHTTGSDDAPELGFNAPEALNDYLRIDLNATRKLGDELEGFIQLINLLDRDNRVPSVLGVAGGIPDQRFGFSIGMRYGM